MCCKITVNYCCCTFLIVNIVLIALPCSLIILVCNSFINRSFSQSLRIVSKDRPFNFVSNFEIYCRVRKTQQQRMVNRSLLITNAGWDMCIGHIWLFIGIPCSLFFIYAA